ARDTRKGPIEAACRLGEPAAALRWGALRAEKAKKTDDERRTENRERRIKIVLLLGSPFSVHRSSFLRGDEMGDLRSGVRRIWATRAERRPWKNSQAAGKFRGPGCGVENI